MVPRLLLPNGDLGFHKAWSIGLYQIKRRKNRIVIHWGMHDARYGKSKTLIEKALSMKKFLKNPHSRVLMRTSGDSSVDLSAIWVEKILIFWFRCHGRNYDGHFWNLSRNGDRNPFPNAIYTSNPFPSSMEAIDHSSQLEFKELESEVSIKNNWKQKSSEG